ncbi:hypothetical protein OEZ86_010424 [Tetradesmus obliquus]|nr:hypothetical protein OEZ86_010424 [Tetradesmus obliquus]
MCKQGTSCVPCGCTHTCAPTGALLQKPLQMCSDGALAQSCEVLSSVKPGSTCAQAGPCKAEYTCTEYLCSSGCIAKCIPDATTGGGGTGTGGRFVPPPPWPPADWPYYCLDGSPAQKCDNPVNSNFNDSCDKLGCGSGGSNGIPRPFEKVLCAPFKCGASDAAVCQMTCVRDVSFSVPPPIPAGPMCPDGKSIAEWCSSGATQEAVDLKCWQLGCEKDGVMCGEFNCSSSSSGGGQCAATCVTDAYYVPYKCPSGRAGRKCNPPMDKAPSCDPPCSQPGTFCAPLFCESGCSYTCLRDPWYTPPSYMCPNTGLIVQECKALAPSGDAACKAKGCGEGQMCRYIDCGAGCAPQCIQDPNFIAPQPSPFLCPANNSTALQCFSSDGAAACGTTAEGVAPAVVCEDGSLCGEFKCGGNSCKAMCVKDPYYRPYLCPVTDKVAKKCDLPPNEANYNCKEDCAAKGPEFFCAPFECDGVCAPVCMKSPYYEPPTYLCDDAGAIIAKQCTPRQIPIPMMGAPRRRSVTKVTSDVMWPPACDPECTEPGYFCMTASCGASGTCSATCVKDENYVPPPPPPTLCADSYSYATLCKAAINDETCKSLQCAEKGFSCAAADCGDGSGCTTKCVTQAYFFPGAPTTPLVYSCDDGMCVTTKKYKGPVNLGTVKHGRTKGSAALKGERVRKCVKGAAVPPRSCKEDPCNTKKCDLTTQKCVREFCGGCLAACVPKDTCRNNTTRRGCIATANFCMTVKCSYNQTCLPNQCNDCGARCFGPCRAGRYASRTTAQCEKCPQGFACSGFNSPNPDPVPCNNGFYAPGLGNRRCRRCPRGRSTPATPATKGHTECK